MDPNALPPRDELLVSALPLVDQVIAQACRRYRLNADEREEFASHVRLKLVDQDYLILRTFRQGCSLRTYLRIVIERLLLDFRNAQWGRWRPSAPARRIGSLGVLLDRLMTRDGLTFDEACNLAQTNYGVAASRDELYAISVQLPHRPKRRMETTIPESVAATYGDADGDLKREEAGRLATRVKAALKAAVARLTPAERQLLDMRYREGRSVSSIARALGEPQKPLYRRMERIVRKVGIPVRTATAEAPGAQADAFRLGDVSISW